MIENSDQKRILITGAGSYIGESFRKYASKHYPQFKIDAISMHGSEWKNYDFSKYDSIFHVAGIAHADIKKASKEEKRRYYEVNTKLAVETARKARNEGVRQFIFMSSMLIYGEAAPIDKDKIITKDTQPEPSNFYGDSKWQADRRIGKLGNKELNTNNILLESGLGKTGFWTAIVRCPMVYGERCKGNYPKLSKLARKIPVFPDIHNKRSMIYIGNLCEFICRLIINGSAGIFYPQNAEVTGTAELFKAIRTAYGKKTYITKLLNPVVRILSYIPGSIGKTVNKVFGSCCYDTGLSDCGFDYITCEFEQSVRLSEHL